MQHGKDWKILFKLHWWVIHKLSISYEGNEVSWIQFLISTTILSDGGDNIVRQIGLTAEIIFYCTYDCSIHVMLLPLQTDTGTTYFKNVNNCWDTNISFYLKTFGACIIKFITAVIYVFCNKLECLSLACLSSLV